MAQLLWRAEVMWHSCLGRWRSRSIVDAEGEAMWHSCSGKPSSRGTVALEGRGHVAQLTWKAEVT